VGKERVHLFRGAVLGTLLRNDALSFIGIGTLIERAYATTQLLLIKDQQLSSDPDPVANTTGWILCLTRSAPGKPTTVSFASRSPGRR
jgi:uncharacterized alpha-E superfamily protein